MKRIFILFLALMPMMATAQNYKPLIPVDVPNQLGNIIKVQELTRTLSGATYYFSSHRVGTRGMTAEMGVPFVYDMNTQIKANGIEQGVTAKMFVGGEEYSMTVYWVSDKGDVYWDIMGTHIKHIAVSGIQKIVFHKYGNVFATQEYDAVEQELWRRTAEELIKAIDKYKVL
ncbi:MAG: hypothetical protein J6U51_07760 [Bacteroidales bacterium]|nr:hypothetical protein [Bacteroidales bacterium]